MLKTELGGELRIRVVPHDFVFGPDETSRLLRRFGGTSEQLSKETLRSVAQALQVAWIVEGAYFTNATGWRLDTYIIPTRETGRPMAITFTAGDWFTVTKESVVQISHLILGRTNNTDLTQMTSSGEALQAFSLALFEENTDRNQPKIERLLRSALALDPHFQVCEEALASTLAAEENWQEASETARHLLLAHPNSASAHEILGQIALIQGLRSGSAVDKAIAAREITIASQLEPDNPNSLIALGQLFGDVRGEWSRAISLFRRAEVLDPGNSWVAAQLASAYANTGELKLAHQEVKCAESQLDDKSDLVLCFLAQVCQFFDDTPRAVHLYKLFVRQARRTSSHPSCVVSAEAALEFLRPRLTVHVLHDRAPSGMTQRELLNALQGVLGQNELKLVREPMETTRSMAHFAKDVGGADNDQLVQARGLFDRVVAQGNPASQPMDGGYDERTAGEAFRAWSDQRASLTCQDFAFLLITLSRDIGIPAYYVSVETDWRGRPVNHACAGLFVNGSLILLDPIYHWFGIPHKVYHVLDDLRATGVYMSQIGTVQAAQIATKVAPGEAQVWLNLAMDLARDGRFVEAGRALDRGAQLRVDPWRVLFAQGVIATYANNSKESLTDFAKCSGFDPDYPPLDYYFSLARKKATDFDYGRSDTLPGQEDKVVALASTNIGALKSVETPTPKAAEAGHFKQARISFAQGDYDSAVAACTEVLSNDPTNAQAYALRGSAYTMAGRPDKAILDLDTAVLIAPRDASILDARGYANLCAHRFADAVADFKEAIRLQADLKIAYTHLAWVFACCPIASVRDGPGAVEAASRACALSLPRREWSSLSTLAAAYAETGDFASAVRYQTEVVQMTNLPPSVHSKMLSLLHLFERHSPYRGDPK